MGSTLTDHASLNSFANTSSPCGVSRVLPDGSSTSPGSVTSCSVVSPSVLLAPASAVKPRYDVVLVAPGDAPILLLRALRDATGKSLRELTDLIATTPVALQEALPRRDADALVARIDAAGAGAVLKVRKR